MISRTNQGTGPFPNTGNLEKGISQGGCEKHVEQHAPKGYHNGIGEIFKEVAQFCKNTRIVAQIGIYRKKGKDWEYISSSGFSEVSIVHMKGIMKIKDMTNSNINTAMLPAFFLILMPCSSFFRSFSVSLHPHPLSC